MVSGPFSLQSGMQICWIRSKNECVDMHWRSHLCWRQLFLYCHPVRRSICFALLVLRRQESTHMQRQSVIDALSPNFTFTRYECIKEHYFITINIKESNAICFFPLSYTTLLRTKRLSYFSYFKYLYCFHYKIFILLFLNNICTYFRCTR